MPARAGGSAVIAWLAPLFAVTAALYASVGFAGGSTYTALLVFADVDFAVLPRISLVCNIIVSAGGAWRFASVGAIAWRRVVPLLIVSVPLAWLGGSLLVSKGLFVLLLGGALVVAGLLLLLGGTKGRVDADAVRAKGPGWVALAIAAPVGLLSGVVGIGGGIFLAPILHLIRWDASRQIAGTAAIFIFVNSVAGLAGQLYKGEGIAAAALFASWWPLFIAVLVGGSIGSLIGARMLPAGLIRRVTGVVVLLAAVRLLTS
jgi:uncharacterized protein